jgi:hypothetical protein
MPFKTLQRTFRLQTKLKPKPPQNEISQFFPFLGEILTFFPLPFP